MHGRAVDALESVTARVLAILRVASLVVLVAYVVIWQDWYLGSPERLVAVVGDVLWDLVFIGVAMRGRISNWLVVGEFVTAVIIGVGAPCWLPPQSLGDGGTWIFRVLTGAGFVAAWRAPAAVFPAVVAVLGVVQFSSAPTAMPQVAGSTSLLVAVCLVFRLAATRLRRNAVAADARLAVAAGRLRAATVADARWRDRRERERVIHDTVLNTLTGIGWGGGADDELTRRRCARSVEAMTDLIAGNDWYARADLTDRIGRLAADARDNGLDVQVRIHRDVDTQPPPVVVAALSAAAGEALTNVTRHARTHRATVVVHWQDDHFYITVSDDGVGFDPGRADPQRLGLRASIAERVADVGGSIKIDSRPGHGTTVEMAWRAPASRVDPAEAADAAAYLRRHYDTGVRRMVALAVACWQGLLALAVLGYWGRVHRPVVSVALWVAIGVGVALAVRVTRHRRLNRLEAVGVALLALTTAAAGGLNTTGGDTIRMIDWPATMALPVLLVLVVVSRPAREWLVAVAAATVLLVSIVLLGGDTGPIALSRLTAAVYGLWSLQALITAFGPALRSTAEATAQAMQDEAELAGRTEAAARILADRDRGLRDIDSDTLPLLRAIAGGQLDPRDPAVRERCTRRASVLRRTLAATAGPPGSLGVLEPVVEAAESRGIDVEVQLAGDLRRCPGVLQEGIVVVIGQALRSVPAGPVLLTVLSSPESGSVFVSFPVAAGTFVDPVRLPQSWPGPVLEVSADVADGRACLELRWPVPT
ncbi:ATP-binding protein [Frankia sp. Cas3]|uniref:ATP-binding protein n=1 Tax=Frankia sp. Cas3 TaxID=3073926 RepID=UPI002AD59DD3|nr:ATP-binding protein [Frankia sp. Cas3]